MKTPNQVKEAAEIIKAVGLGGGCYEEDCDNPGVWYIEVDIADKHGCILSYCSGEFELSDAGHMSGGASMRCDDQRRQ